METSRLTPRIFSLQKRKGKKCRSCDHHISKSENQIIRKINLHKREEGRDVVNVVMVIFKMA